MDTAELINAIVAIIIAAGGSSLATYIVFKHKLRAFRELIDELDDALYDNKVTEEEFRRLWEKFKALIS